MQEWTSLTDFSKLPRSVEILYDFPLLFLLFDGQCFTNAAWQLSIASLSAETLTQPAYFALCAAHGALFGSPVQGRKLKPNAQPKAS